MQALVLSGGGNYGAMQAGALEVLLEAGLQPGMVVGSSAGALNALSIAADPTPEGARRLQAVWRDVQQGDVGRLNLLQGVYRWFIGRQSLLSNRPLQDFMKHNIPDETETFSQLAERAGVRAYALAVCMETSELVAFGDRDDDRLLDGALASTAVPPYFPPWQVKGKRYVDGSVRSPLPIRVAFERGATSVVALHLRPSDQALAGLEGPLAPSLFAISSMLRAQADAEIAWAHGKARPLRVIQLTTPTRIAFWNYGEAEKLIALGRVSAMAALEGASLKPKPSGRIDWPRRFLPVRWLRALGSAVGDP